MIAIGGAIGTGLVIGSGSSLARSGPGSLFISYLVMGIVSIDRSPRGLRSLAKRRDTTRKQFWDETLISHTHSRRSVSPSCWPWEKCLPSSLPRKVSREFAWTPAA